MNVISLILAIIAAAVFILSHRQQAPQATTNLGLFFLTLAWMAQLLLTMEPVTL